MFLIRCFQKKQPPAEAENKNAIHFGFLFS